MDRWNLAIRVQANLSRVANIVKYGELIVNVLADR